MIIMAARKSHLERIPTRAFERPIALTSPPDAIDMRTAPRSSETK
jgi:hypothetical protein